MVKCNDCGFLAVWMVKEQEFVEASDHLRVCGHPEIIAINPMRFKVKCFIQEYDLDKEITGDAQYELAKYKACVVHNIGKARTCESHIPWIQGFHPKERKEMIRQEELRKSERRHANISLGVAVFAAVATAAGGVFGAYMTKTAATLEADATRDSAKWQVEALQKQTDAQLKMTKMQIEAQKEIAKMTPAPQIIVRIPPASTK
ncbi:MAG: hypothetical protein CV089_16285 [Nitrospira sp. WS110]|nr:hypothetical protein [Nitrospira sp. WS110]